MASVKCILQHLRLNCEKELCSCTQGIIARKKATDETGIQFNDY